jgi:hypothetical protein
MPFQYGCFVSYAHDSDGLVERFIGDLERALKAELGAYLDEDNKLFLDRERLSGGLSHPAVLDSCVHAEVPAEGMVSQGVPRDACARGTAA